jgi:hypothetical protein
MRLLNHHADRRRGDMAARGARAARGSYVPYRVRSLPVARDAPAMLSLLDELRMLGVVEGRNLEIVPDGFLARNDQINDPSSRLRLMSSFAAAT